MHAAIARLVLLWLTIVAGVVLPASAMARTPILIEGKKHLYLRVLTRPHATLYASPQDAAQVIQSNLPHFKAYYVYTRPGDVEREDQKGWYEVGSNERGAVKGWIRTEDVFEWKQALCLVYTSARDRNPVLFFDKKEDVAKIVEAQGEERKRQINKLYKDIFNHNIPAGFPVSSMEPREFIDWKKEPYLVPIFDFENEQFGRWQGCLLKVASIVPDHNGQQAASDIRTNAEYRQAAIKGPESVAPKTLQELKIDIVWVFDTTISTQPYIDAALQAAQQTSQELATASKAVNSDIRFGVWGFRCPVRHTPGIEYDTRNYTPQLQPIEAFTQTLSQVRSATVSTGDWPEDVFTGMGDAITKTNWNKKGLRYIILVGDAPGHHPGHPKNDSGLDAYGIQKLAKDNDVFINTFYISDPRARDFLAKGIEQFATMRSNEHARTDVPNIITSRNFSSITHKTQKWIKACTEQLQSTSRGEIPPIITQEAKTFEEKILRAGIVEWIGKMNKTKAPRDITGWVADKDLENFAVQTLNPHLLLSKRQLNALVQILTDIVAKTEQGKTSSTNMFDQIRKTTAQATRTPDRLGGDGNADASRNIPEFIENLPYKSQFMLWTQQYWTEEMSEDEQNDFINKLKGKIAYYKKLAETPDIWIDLTGEHDADANVFPIALTQLP